LPAVAMVNRHRRILVVRLIEIHSGGSVFGLV
jgi:hypothetical protein